MARWTRRACGLMALAVCAACGGGAGVPVTVAADAGGDVATGQVAKKLDVLWVVDNSVSMLQHQRVLGQAWRALEHQWLAMGPVDVRMASVTVQQLPDVQSGPDTLPVPGRFMHRSAQRVGFTPTLGYYLAPCGTPTTFVDAPSEECRTGFDHTFHFGTGALPLPVTSLPAIDASQDVTVHYAPTVADTELATKNPWRCSGGYVLGNGSLRGGCMRRCQTDAECQTVFGDPTALCGAALNSTYCFVPPLTQDCPPDEALPAILDSAHVNWLHCIAMTDGTGTHAGGFEGGLRAAWLALDPQGPNCPDSSHCQHDQFLRPDADLVLAFVTDGDDCSLAVNAPQPTDDEMDLCETAGDADGGSEALAWGRCLYVKQKQAKPAEFLCPTDCADSDAACQAAAATNIAAMHSALTQPNFGKVADFWARFQSLKAQPGHVKIVVVGADTLAQRFPNGVQATASMQVRIDRAAFLREQFRTYAASQSVSLAQTRDRGVGYSGRYFALAALAGQQGWSANLADDDLSARFTDLAKWLVSQ